MAPHYLSLTGEELDNALAKIPELEQAVADLKYIPIDVTGIRCSPGTMENGATVNSVEISWSLNKAAAEAELTGPGSPEKVPITLEGAVTISELELTADTKWTVLVKDERGVTDSATTGVTFLNGVYYGAAVVPDVLDSAFILSLEKKALTNSRKQTLTVEAVGDEHIWYALPSRLGVCTFTVGGFEGGFDLVSTMPFTNSQGFTEEYLVYRSGQTGLGNTKVVIT